MPRPPALTAAQEKQIRARVRAGADLPSLVAFAKGKEWKVSPARLGQIMKGERDRIAEAPAPAVEVAPIGSALAEQVAELRAQVASLQGRLDAMLHIPRAKLSDVANGAVEIARQMLGDPGVDPSAKAKVMAQMPDLIDSARKALEAERASGDEDLGG